MVAAANLYLPDDCWDCVINFLNIRYDDGRGRDLQSLSFVSKQFLTITNRQRFTINILDPTRDCLGRLFQRFPNLTSLYLTITYLNLKHFLLHGFCWISTLASSIRTKYTQTNSLENSNSFVVSSQLKSLHLNFNPWLRDESIRMLASIFPNLELLNLSYCDNISEYSICHVLRRCSNIRHLKLTCCLKVKLHEMNFEAPKLEVLNLSHTDDEALHVISKSCRGLLRLLLEYCSNVTKKGVKHVVENCTQLREINLWHCCKVHGDALASLIFSRPSLRKITLPGVCGRTTSRNGTGSSPPKAPHRSGYQKK